MPKRLGYVKRGRTTPAAGPAAPARELVGGVVHFEAGGDSGHHGPAGVRDDVQIGRGTARAEHLAGRAEPAALDVLCYDAAMTFMECVDICASNKELVANFDRLRGTHLSRLDKRAAIDALIDDATGRDDDAARLFIDFVWEFVWTRLPYS